VYTFRILLLAFCFRYMVVLYFFKQISKDPVAVQGSGYPVKMPGMIKAIGDLISENGSMADFGGEPTGVDGIGHGRNIPDHFRPGIMIVMIILENFHQIVTDSALSLQVSFYLRHCRMQV